jgi:3-oxoacyl-[acyl-carrier-protein] synthase III
VVLQHKFGAKNAGTFDVDCACAAFPALVAIGAGLIATNAAMKTLLLVGVDMFHRLTDLNDPGCFLWSDWSNVTTLPPGRCATAEARHAVDTPLCRACFQYPNASVRPHPIV